MHGKMEIRAVQLDLARQMETLPFIKEFIDFASGFGYNNLVLYLEGRVRTKSFPYPARNASYSPEEMAEIVAYASGKGMGVIPVVSNLGHTEQFLRYPALAPLAELRDGRRGRFSRRLSVVCPSLEATYAFFEAYYSEIAAIFPSPYFHIGNDESWDIGYCPLCRRRLKKGETQSDIFAAHLKRTHRFVTGKLGKKMVMWDDLFEHYRQCLFEIPRDIVLCCWLYDELVDIPRAHFCNRRREDWLKLYDKLGFSYLIAPADKSAANGETFTRYAYRYKPLGGHLTTWEKGTSFLYEHYPTLAYIGRLWQHGWPEDPVKLFHQVNQEIFQVTDPGFLEAVRVSQYLGSCFLPGRVEELLRGSFTPSENKRFLVREYLYRQLLPFLAKVSSLGKKVLEDILNRLQEESITHRLRQAVAGVSGPATDQEKRWFLSLGQLALKQVKELKEKRIEQWQEHRAGLPSERMAEKFDLCQENLTSFFRLFVENKSPSFLWVNYFLPDAYNAQKVRISLWNKRKNTWNQVYSGVPKPNLLDPGQTPYFTLGTQLPSSTRPEKVRIEAWGYGGIGFTYLKLVTPKGVFVPTKIIRKKGLVFHPEMVLVDDSRWCWLGDQDVAASFLDTKRAEKIHLLEIILTKS
ncbi:MAG: family 20 glycosylhydrolase [Candidatus Omnitrophica bacterium]|nr:family 20 glycosylhydrolase [Candidatus Omnitrophota bacterium]MCM8768086.1 family 20 glycosylhydrolase [Candidatus Omnitrophota bacterium]